VDSAATGDTPLPTTEIKSKKARKITVLVRDCMSVSQGGCYGGGTEKVSGTVVEKPSVVEHSEVFDHVNLLFDEHPGKAGLAFV